MLKRYLETVIQWDNIHFNFKMMIMKRKKFFRSKKSRFLIYTLIFSNLLYLYFKKTLFLISNFLLFKLFHLTLYLFLFLYELNKNNLYLFIE